MGRQLIDFSKMTPEKKKIQESFEAPIEIRQEHIDRLEDSLNLLKKMYPDKILFSVKEASKILNLSTDFIRDRFWDNRINFKKFGKRKMIHILEMARLINEGTE